MKTLLEKTHTTIFCRECKRKSVRHLASNHCLALTKLMSVVLEHANLGMDSQTSVTILPTAPELGQLIPSSPLMPAHVWQDRGQDFMLFDQGDEMDFTRQAPAVNGSAASDRFNTFSWPEPAILPSNSSQGESDKSSLDGISPRSKVHASETEYQPADSNHTEMLIDQFESVNESARAENTASSKNPAENHSAGFEVRRRAKNRIAAGKSRAKSKRYHEALQERYEQSLDQNNALKHQEQALRAAAAFLKDCLLQHNSSSCSCQCLHQFNRSRAESIARGIANPGGMVV